MATMRLPAICKGETIPHGALERLGIGPFRRIQNCRSENAFGMAIPARRLDCSPAPWNQEKEKPFAVPRDGADTGRSYHGFG